MSDLLDLSEAPAKRPAFITVLCILTFVGAGIGILSGIYSLLTVQNTIETLERFNSLSKGFGVFQDTMSSQITALKKYGMLSAGMNAAGSALCLFGALKMWNLSKMGFYLYIAGQVIAIIGGMLIMGTGFFASPILIMIFPAAFIVMYAVNLKHMK